MTPPEGTHTEPGEFIDASEFWSLYFQNRIVELRRDATRLAGRYTPTLPSGRSFLYLQDPIAFQISRETLARHDYLADGRLSEIERRPADLAEALARLVDRTYPYRAPPPFGSLRMSEVVERTIADHRWSVEYVELEMIHGSLPALADQLPDTTQQLDAMVWLLGERQSRSSAAPLVALLEGSEQLPQGHKRRLSHSVTSSALEALWKLNDKSVCDRLIAVMEAQEPSPRARFAALFKRLFSTTELLGPELLGDRYLSAEFWRAVLAQGQGFSSGDWDRFDAGSLFWENRHLSCRRLSAGDEALRLLCGDEVSLIATRAQKKLLESG